MTKVKTGMFISKGFHGTVLERPFMDELAAESILYDNVKVRHNELQAFYTTNQMSMADVFADRYFVDDENQVIAVLDYSVMSDNAYIIEGDSSGYIEYKGIEYSMNELLERRELHKELRKDGYEALVLKDHYTTEEGQKCDDVAVLTRSILHINGLHIGNEEKVFYNSKEKSIQGLINHFKNNEYSNDRDYC